MKMKSKMKKITVATFSLFSMLLLCGVSSVFAGPGTGTGICAGPGNVPEPMSYLLLASGGATLTGIRYWMAKRRSKKNAEASIDVESN